MGSIDPAVDETATKVMIQNDRRDIKDLWNEALKEYRSILGEDLRPDFVNVNSMINYGVEQMNNFHRFRHDASKVDKLRTLFMGNIHLIETGTQKIISAATPAFPPAAAIGTAITFILKACRSVSADYDVVTAFFEDMNSFLQRVSILESRLPQGTYQTFLMDVFTALLRMCAIATKFIRLGRLKKWIINAFKGDDSELAGARKKMDKTIGILQSATEFQILANSEDTIRMQEELKQNQEVHNKQADEQLRILQTVQEGQTNIVEELDEIKQLLLFRQQEQTNQSVSMPLDPVKQSLSRVRSAVHEVPGHAVQLQMIRQSHVEHTGEWLWEDATWKKWEATKFDGAVSPWLLLLGPAGIGKSHLAVTVYDQLRQKAAQKPKDQACTAYAFCRDTVESMASLKSALNTIILQIADQNAIVREELNLVLSRDDYHVSEDDFFHELIMPMFSKSSKHKLTLDLVIDSINELTQEDRTRLSSLLKLIEEQQLKIKAIFTSRNSIELTTTGSSTVVSCIQISKAQMLPDLKRVISARLQSTDSAYQGLTRLGRYVKSKVANVIEEKADGILYAEYMIQHLSSIGREGAIVKELDVGMPDNMEGLFEKLMKVSQRKIPAGIAPAVKSLLAWISFSFDPLTLAGANLLVQTESDNMDLFVEDQIKDILNRFLWIGSTLPENSEVAAVADENGDATLLTQPMEFDDGQLEVVLRERSMREYFRQAARDETSLRTYETLAHKEIFLFCCQVIARHRSFDSDSSGRTSGRKILDYALKYCLQHWMSIKPTDIHLLSDEDKRAICEAFRNLLSDDYGFASALEIANLGLSIENLFDLHAYPDPEIFWNETLPAVWNAWANTVSNMPIKSGLQSETARYWKGNASQAFVPLASAHLRNWLDARDYERVRSAYNLARKTIRRTTMKELLHQDFPTSSQLDYLEGVANTLPSGTVTCVYGDEYNDEIIHLQKAAGLADNSNIHYATSVIMNNYGLQDAAISEMDIAVKMCADAGERARDYIYMARIYSSMMRGTTMLIEYIDMALAERQTMSPSLIIDALKVKAEAWTRLCCWDKAIEVFTEIRSIDSKIWIPTDYLGDEFWLYTTKAQVDQMPALPLDAFMSWKPIQRLALLTDFASTRMSNLAVHKALLESALSVGRIDDLIAVYQEVIKSLDIDGCGAVWRKQLACIYWRVLGDTETAKKIMNQVLDSSSKGQEYSLGKGSLDVGVVALEAVSTMCDILYQQFRASNGLEAKQKTLETLKGLTGSRLVGTVGISNSLEALHFQTMARMIQKVGDPVKFERVLHQAFQISYDNLNDPITWNDSRNSVQLAKVVSQLPGMKRDAEILLSSQLYYLEPHTEAEMLDYTRESEYSYYCNIEGVCKYVGERWKIPACHRCGQTWTKWDDNYPPISMYTCLLCTDSVLCQDCYDKRMEYNKIDKVPANEQNFCCKNGQYLKSPMEGWQGIKFGVIHIEGQEPIAFNDFLGEVRKHWEAAWEEYWTG